MKSQTAMNLLPTFALAFLGLFPTAGTADTVVAKVGAREVTASEVQPFLEALAPADRAALAADQEALGAFVRSILVRQAVLQDATGAGWDKKPETVAGLERLRDQYIVESYLAEVGKVPEGFPSGEDLKKAYEAEKGRLQLPRRYKLGQIFIAQGEDKEAARKKAAELARTLEDEPGEFAALAKRNSDDTASASRGGDLGWLSADEITPAIRTAVAGLSQGEISAPVEGRSGFHILRVEEIRPAGPASFDEVKDQLSAALRNQRAALNREAHVASLLQKNPVSVNELALDALQPERVTP
jgi:parvulin-like peptidyl-prolyl isomerase